MAPARSPSLKWPSAFSPTSVTMPTISCLHCTFESSVSAKGHHLHTPLKPKNLRRKIHLRSAPQASAQPELLLRYPQGAMRPPKMLWLSSGNVTASSTRLSAPAKTINGSAECTLNNANALLAQTQCVPASAVCFSPALSLACTYVFRGGTSALHLLVSVLS